MADKASSERTLSFSMDEATAAKPFRLLDLQPEIRLIIYTFAVKSAKHLSWSRRSQQAPDENAAVPQVCQASSLVRQESLPVFFGSNVFDLKCGDKEMRMICVQWLDVHAVHLGLLRKVVVKGWLLSRPDTQSGFTYKQSGYAINIKASRVSVGFKIFAGLNDEDAQTLPWEAAKLRAMRKVAIDHIRETAIGEDYQLTWSHISLLQLLKELSFVATAW